MGRFFSPFSPFSTLCRFDVSLSFFFFFLFWAFLHTKTCRRAFVARVATTLSPFRLPTEKKCRTYLDGGRWTSFFFFFTYARLFFSPRSAIAAAAGRKKKEGTHNSRRAAHGKKGGASLVTDALLASPWHYNAFTLFFSPFLIFPFFFPEKTAAQVCTSRWRGQGGIQHGVGHVQRPIEVHTLSFFPPSLVGLCSAYGCKGRGGGAVQVLFDPQKAHPFPPTTKKGRAAKKKKREKNGALFHA